MADAGPAGRPRHRMVRVHPQAWAGLLAGRPDLADEPLLPRWADRGWPLVVRRPGCGDVEGFVPLGLPLPPAAGRKRLMLGLPPEALTGGAPPPLLRAAAGAAPAAWRPAIAEILALDGRVRCFGGLAWQHLTGLPYLTEHSDLDLIWAVRGREQADRLAAGLMRIDETAPMKIDGEFATSGHLAVQWREWSRGAPEVMVKGADGISLVPRESWLA
jgi:phosphoribosyl-dephospho-CoA transferase